MSHAEAVAHFKGSSRDDKRARGAVGEELRLRLGRVVGCTGCFCGPRGWLGGSWGGRQ
eukprot:gene7836-392_t